MKGKVYVKIPKSGLGNCMLVWAYGLVFASTNNLELITSRWWRFRWGALVRRERKKRLYVGYFKEEKISKKIKIRLNLIFQKRIYNPLLGPVDLKSSEKIIYIFDRLPANGYFIKLYPYLSLIKESLFKILSKPVLKELQSCEKPSIGVHIRRGDFKISNQVTPISYFIEVISIIRDTVEETLPVTVFTDADPDEIKQILALPNIHIAKNNSDIVDMIQLSQSTYLILSRDSSFSYWAAFLAEAFVIMRGDDWQKQLKPNSDYYFECRWPLPGINSKEQLINLIKNRTWNAK